MWGENIASDIYLDACSWFDAKCGAIDSHAKSISTTVSCRIDFHPRKAAVARNGEENVRKFSFIEKYCQLDSVSRDERTITWAW